MTPPVPLKVLIAEDDLKTADLIALYLRHAGHVVRVEHDGTRAQQRARTEAFDVVVLDVMLPGVDGLTICRDLAGSGGAAVILLTARTQEHQRVEGLQLGADDYVSKPFSPRELVARVEAVMRRRVSASARADAMPRELHVGSLVLHLDERRVRLRDRDIRLTRSEFAILEALASRPGRVLSRGQLLHRLPTESRMPTERTVDAHIRNLRCKIETVPSAPEWIRTATGFGYTLHQVD